MLITDDMIKSLGKKFPKLAIYTSHNGDRITIGMWTIQLVKFADNLSWVEMYSSYKGKKNYYVHAHKDNKDNKDNKDGIYFINLHSVKVPLYAQNLAKQFLDIAS